MPFCRQCGEKIDAGDQFCESCGTPVVKKEKSSPDPGRQPAESSHVPGRLMGLGRKLAAGRIVIMVAVVLLLVSAGLAVRYYWNSRALEEKLALGQSQLDQGDCEQAIASYTEAMAIDDRAAAAYIGLIRAYERSGRSADSRDLAQRLEKEIGAAGLSVEENIALARFYIDNMQYQRAVSLVEEAVRAHGSDPLLTAFRDTMAGGGNSQGNIINGGFVAMYEDWIYYLDYNQGLFRIKKDGSGREKVCGDNALYINPTSEWIYYVNEEDQHLYRIRPDGSSRHKLNSDECQMPILHQDYVYYIADGDSKHKNMLFRIRKDGSERQQLTFDVSIHGFGFVGEEILFPAGNDILCKMGADGGDWQQLWPKIKDSKGSTLDQEIGMPVIWDGQVYGMYMHEEEGNTDKYSISAFNRDGQLTETIYDASRPKEIWGFNLDGNTAVFFDDNESVIKKVDRNGNTPVTLTEPAAVENIGDFNPRSLCLLDGWVYYFVDQGTTGIHRARLDGSANEVFTEWEMNR